jgi:hypothetical protein
VLTTGKMILNARFETDVNRAQGRRRHAGTRRTGKRAVRNFTGLGVFRLAGMPYDAARIPSGGSVLLALCDRDSPQ